MKLENTSKVIKLHYIKIVIYLLFIWIYDVWIVDYKRSILDKHKSWYTKISFDLFIKL